MFPFRHQIVNSDEMSSNCSLGKLDFHRTPARGVLEVYEGTSFLSCEIDQFVLMRKQRERERESVMKVEWKGERREELTPCHEDVCLLILLKKRFVICST